MKEMFMRLVREEEGQAMAEYGLIIALVAVVVIGALTLLGTRLDVLFGEIEEKLVIPEDN